MRQPLPPYAWRRTATPLSSHLRSAGAAQRKGRRPRPNPGRRAALVDAAIEVLAREGARGLTFRAVDTEAAVPRGTASYFASRDDLLHQAGLQIHQRLGPDPQDVVEAMRAPRSTGLVGELMRAVFHRLSTDPTSYLALLELRLEATRRPELQAALTRTIQSNLDENIKFHLDSGLPGDRATAVLL